MHAALLNTDWQIAVILADLANGRLSPQHAQCSKNQWEKAFRPPCSCGIKREFLVPGSNSGGTLTRQANSPYRTPAPPVSPPSLPSNYAPSYIAMQRQISQQQAAAAAHAQAQHHAQGPEVTQQDRRSGYAPVGNIQVAQVGVARWS